VAWVLGGRDSATFKRLYDKVKHLEKCIFYTDDWDAFTKILPPERHISGKAYTIDIEQDNRPVPKIYISTHNKYVLKSAICTNIVAEYAYG